MSTRIAFLKGHGTENDFVIVPDPENALDLPPAASRWGFRREPVGLRRQPVALPPPIREASAASR
jgi:diaminopimelate epimerase